MSSALLNETLDTIATERGNFCRSFVLVDKLLAEYGEAALAERLYADIPCSRPWEDIADLFAILIWSTSDNGAALTRTTEQWLVASDDVRRIRIALHLDAYPFINRDEMERVLADVAKRHPEVASDCLTLIESRRRDCRS